MYLFLCLKALIDTSLKRICTIQADERRSKENIYDPAGLRIIGPLASKLMFDMEVLKNYIIIFIYRLPHFPWLQGGGQTNIYKICTSGGTKI